MSNYDHAIDAEVAEEIRNKPLCAGYPGWEFYGTVWWDCEKSQWACAVDRYGVHVDTLFADTLEDLMEAVCKEYGYE